MQKPNLCKDLSLQPSKKASHTPETKQPLIQGPRSPYLLFPHPPPPLHTKHPPKPHPQALAALVFVFVFGFSVARGFLGNCELGAEHWETGTAPFVCGYLHDICSYNKPQELLKQQQPQPTGRG